MSLFTINRLSEDGPFVTNPEISPKTSIASLNHQAKLRKQQQISSDLTEDTVDNVHVFKNKKRHKMKAEQSQINDDSTRDELESAAEIVRKKKHSHPKKKHRVVLANTDCEALPETKKDNKLILEKPSNGKSKKFKVQQNSDNEADSVEKTTSLNGLEEAVDKSCLKSKTVIRTNSSKSDEMVSHKKRKFSKKKDTNNVLDESRHHKKQKLQDNKSDETPLNGTHETPMHDRDLENEETSEDSDTAGKQTDDTGFTVIGSVKNTRLQKVMRVLPDWLVKASVISADIRNNKTPLADFPGLDKALVEALQANEISHFFPVQAQVIPVLLDQLRYSPMFGCAGYRPPDLCVSAPTGSGKTLAFVLPIVQGLKNLVTTAVRALVVLPVSDLAVQVHKVFETYATPVGLKVGLMTNQKSFIGEQKSLICKGVRGYHSMVDIIVATPGRLVDHINQTTGFNLQQLRFLVIDEADRTMDKIKQDWLGQVEKAVHIDPAVRPRPGPLTAANASDLQIPLQKLLFSATLSQNPEKLEEMNLFQPRLFTSVVTETQKPVVPHQSPADSTTVVDDDADDSLKGKFIGKFTTPAGLSEHFVQVDAAEKPLVLLHYLHSLLFRHVLCFTNSVETAHRLSLLLKLAGQIVVHEYSSSLHPLRRRRLLRQFINGKIDILICSDAMARGMDVGSARYAISYDCPPYVKTYVHRVGRTARAGNVGTAITLLEKKQIFHFKKMLKEAGKSNVKEMKISKGELKPHVEMYQQALQQLPTILKSEKIVNREKRVKTPVKVPSHSQTS